MSSTRALVRPVARRGLGFLGALLLGSALQAAAGQVSLAWNDNSSDETMFKIERAIVGSTYTQIATVGSNVTAYTDATVTPSTSYWYRVRASNSTGDSAYTNVLTVTAPGSSNSTPLISDISNLTISAGTSTGALAFTVSDAETAAGSLTVTGSSSNTTLVPNSAIVFGGSGNSRTISVTPVASQSGTATITVTVSDGTLTASDTFTLTVNAAANTAPTISTVASQTITSGGSTGAIAFTVGDAETAAASLSVTRNSSNTTVVPLTNVVLGGSGSSRTVNVTAATGQSGTSTITLTVSDGALTKSTSFSVTAIVSNSPPVISDIPDTSISAGTSSNALAFTVSDATTAADSLVVTASSSNTALVPNTAIACGGSGSNRTVTVTPVATQTGTSTITVSVSDGALTATDTFVLTVNGTNSDTSGTFSTPASISIPGNGPALLYPAPIGVSGLSGTVSNVTVRLDGFNQTWAKEVDVLLVSPTGQKLLLMSDAGTGSVTNATLIFSDDAAGFLPQNESITSGTYKPTNYDTETDAFSAPAPVAPYATTLAAFNGQNPNGQWLLYVMADGPAQGSFSGGWTLTITTAGNTAYEAPKIVTQPTNQTVREGQTATFKVVATGTPNPTYQWLKDGVAVQDPAWQQPALVLDSVGLEDGGVYRVEVKNPYGSVVSENVTLSVRRRKGGR